MTEMIDRVAAAMFPSRFNPELVVVNDPDALKILQRKARRLARRAVAAIQEPTPEMVLAGQDALFERSCLGDVYTAMVKQALGAEDDL